MQEYFKSTHKWISDNAADDIRREAEKDRNNPNFYSNGGLQRKWRELNQALFGNVTPQREGSVVSKYQAWKTEAQAVKKRKEEAEYQEYLAEQQIRLQNAKIRRNIVLVLFAFVALLVWWHWPDSPKHTQQVVHVYTDAHHTSSEAVNAEEFYSVEIHKRGIWETLSPYVFSLKFWVALLFSGFLLKLAIAGSWFSASESEE